MLFVYRGHLSLSLSLCQIAAAPYCPGYCVPGWVNPGLSPEHNISLLDTGWQRMSTDTAGLCAEVHTVRLSQQPENTRYECGHVQNLETPISEQTH